MKKIRNHFNFFAVIVATALCFFSTPLFGQGTLSGLVIAADQQKPLKTATVFVQETGQLVEVDKSGRFEFGHPSDGDKLTLTVFADGYTTQVLEADPKENIVLEIEVSPLSADISELIPFIIFLLDSR